MTKMPAIHFVALASFASIDFALFFARNVSELPLSAPLSPEFFPDWMATTAISEMQIISCTITNMILKVSTLFILSG